MLVSIMSCCDSSTFVPGSAVFHLLAKSAAAAAAATLQLPGVSVPSSQNRMIAALLELGLSDFAAFFVARN